WGDSLGSTSPHSPTHEWSDGAIGSDPLNVHIRAMVPGRAYLATTGTTSIFVNTLEYEYLNTGTVWGGTPGIDLSPTITDTTTGTMRYAGVYIDMATNTLAAVTGTTTIHSDALTPPLVSFPSGVLPIARIKVYGNQTALSEADITDARRPFNLGGITALIDDTSPQAGGDVDMNSFELQFDNATGIRDSNDNAQLLFNETGSAVTHLEITNAATGDGPGLAAAGETNTDFLIDANGSGNLILQNTATGKVGVGTDSPVGTLHSENLPSAFTGSGEISLFIGDTASHAFPGRYNLFAIGHTLNAGHGNDIDTAGIFLNYTGYQAGHTRYRDLVIGNGKGTELMRVHGSSGNVGIGASSPGAPLHIDQSSPTGAKPVLTLDQADVSEPFTAYIGRAAAATLTQSIVAEADVTTATRRGFLKINVQDDGNQITDQDYFIPIYTLA
ncbi:MAG: hypothetical protein GY796_36535, partial [Chloroflexi bacterium]|nr:hypothetical protein [Chloroflexota bacterium]